MTCQSPVGFQSHARWPWFASFVFFLVLAPWSSSGKDHFSEKTFSHFPALDIEATEPSSERLGTPWECSSLWNGLKRVRGGILDTDAVLAGPTTWAAHQELGADVTPGKSFVYKESAGKPRKMEIYFPPNHDVAKAQVPGVIMFHGGAWRGGSLSQFRSLCQYLASRGIVAATAEYRMLTDAEAKDLPRGETRKRVCVTDAKSAIRWFKAHARELGINPDRIITGGGSAGGHICVLATQQAGLNDPNDPEDVDTSVVAYLLFNPAFALDDESDPEIDVMKQIKPNLAPALVFFGTNDEWKKGWDVLQTRLAEQGSAATTELWLADGQPHGFFNRDPWKTLTLLEVDRFLVELGALKGAATITPPTTGEKLRRVELR